MDSAPATSSSPAPQRRRPRRAVVIGLFVLAFALLFAGLTWWPFLQSPQGPVGRPTIGPKRPEPPPKAGKPALRTPTESGWAMTLASHYPHSVIPFTPHATGLTLDERGRALVICSLPSGTALDPDHPDAPLDFDSRDLTTTLAVYSPEGTLEWTYSLPSSTGESAPIHVRTAADGSVYLLGQFWGTLDFDAGPGTTVLRGPSELLDTWDETASLFTSTAHAKSIELPQQHVDTFLLALTADGQFRWVRQWAAWAFFDPSALAVSPAGEPHLLFLIYGEADIDPGPGEVKIPRISNVAMPPRQVLVRLGSDGEIVGHRTWTPFHRGTPDFDTQLEFDATGNAFIAGSIEAPAELAPAPGSFILEPLPEHSKFVYLEKLDPIGALLWVDTWPIYSTYGVKLAVAPSGHTVIGGRTETHIPIDFDPGPAEHLVAHDPTSNDTGFVMSIDPAGALEWVRTEGDSFGHASAIARTPDGAVYLAGMFRSIVDFDPGPAEAKLTAISYSSDPRRVKEPRDDYPHDAYLVRFTPQGDFDWVTSWGGEHQDEAIALQTDAQGRLLLSGYSKGDTDLDPGPRTAEHSAKRDEGRSWVLSIDPGTSFE